MAGYVSQGGVSDNESARLSNVNTFKYNNINSLNIRKVSPDSMLPIINKMPP